MKNLESRLALIILILISLNAIACSSARIIQPDAQAAEPRYVILMVGDGMGFEQINACSIYLNGRPGTLSFESFPFSGETTNRSADSEIADSAASATAIATGTKVNNGVISSAIPGDGSELGTLLEHFKNEGMRTGLVTTTFMTDATPAAFGSHEPSRSRYGQIAQDYFNQTKPNVLFGGGGFGMSVSAAETAGYAVVTNAMEMKELDTDTASYVSGQFGVTYLPYEMDGLGNLPHLSEMTAAAIKILDNDPDGFFLLVEGGKIDQACHGSDIARSIHETAAFDRAVQVVLEWAQGRTNTLILVTADHETGGLKVESSSGAGTYPNVSWSTGSHTASNVPIYAWGLNSGRISGVMDNTEIFKIVTLVKERSLASGLYEKPSTPSFLPWSIHGSHGFIPPISPAVMTGQWEFTLRNP